eukprot:GGOE01008203.1.p1 GENE.GGOE01008203.1~~GGOE01008203.1.p1  ORF type:complete len:1072 (+),score=266.21 GGOE01008203.1:68-3283(+)
MEEEALHQLKVEVKRAAMAAKTRVAVHLSLCSKGAEVKHQQTTTKLGPNPQWQQQFTFDVGGLVAPVLKISLRNAQTDQVLGQEIVNVTDLPLNRPLANDLAMKGASVFLVLLATSQSTTQQQPRLSPASSDHSVGAESAVPPLLDRSALPPRRPQPTLEVKVTSAKGFESLPACSMCVEARCGQWVVRTPPLPNQAVALWNHSLGLAVLGETPEPLALEVLDSDTGLVLGAGVLNLASLQWAATSPTQLQSVLMMAGDVQVGTVSVLLRTTDPVALAAWCTQAPRPPSRPPAFLNATALPLVPIARSLAPSTALVELLLRKSEGTAADAVLRLRLPGTAWTYCSPAMKEWRATHRVCVPVPSKRPAVLRLDVALHPNATNLEVAGVGSLDLSNIPEHPIVHRMALAHPVTGRQAGSLELHARFLTPVPLQAASSEPTPWQLQAMRERLPVPLAGDGDARASPAISTEQVVDGTFQVRSLEFKLSGQDSSFWEREGLLSAQVTLKSRANVVGQRTKPTPKGPVVRWADSLRFALVDRASTVEVQLWEQQGAGQQLMGMCSVMLPDREQEQNVKVLLRPTPLYAQLTITVLAQYSVRYGQRLPPSEDAVADVVAGPPQPLPGPTPSRTELQRPRKLPATSDSSPVPTPSPPTNWPRMSRPMTPSGRPGGPPAAREEGHLVPTTTLGPKPPQTPPGTVMPLQQMTGALAAVPSPLKHCPAYVRVARSKDSLQTLSGALAPISFLATMAARSPAVTAGLCFGVLVFCYMNWLLQLALTLALGTVVGSKVVRSNVAMLPPKELAEVHRAADDAEERLINLASALAEVSRFFVFRRPTTGLAVFGALLLLSAVMPAYGISLVIGTCALALLLPLPPEDVAVDPYAHVKPVLVLLPWYSVSGWLDDGVMLLGATLYLVCFLHVPILRDYPRSTSIHALFCVFKAAASGIRRPFVGSLRIRVLGAKLKGEDASIRSFALLSAEKGQLRYTQVASGLSPHWDKEWEPVLVSNVQSLQLQVWDASNEGTISDRDHGLIGEAVLNVRGPSEDIEKSVPLTGGRGVSGHLLLRMQVSPIVGD